MKELIKLLETGKFKRYRIYNICVGGSSNKNYLHIDMLDDNYNSKSVDVKNASYEEVENLMKEKNLLWY